MSVTLTEKQTAVLKMQIIMCIILELTDSDSYTQSFTHRNCCEQKLII